MDISSRLYYRLAVLVTVLAAGLFTTTATMAAEIALLAGYQTNSNFEISAASEWPPDNLPEGEPGQSINLDEGSSWAIAINTDYQGNSNQKVGLFYSEHDSAFDSSAGLADPAIGVSFLHFVGTNIYPQGEKLSFFFLGGIGAAFYKPDDPTLKNVTQFSFQFGTGANIKVTENLLLQLEARWLPTLFNGKTSIFCNGGCAITVNSDMFSQFQMNAGILLRF